MTKKIKGKMLAPSKITDDGWEWLQMEAGNRADSIASVVRSVFQKEADKAKKKGLM